jgi:hypothetical protein
MNQDNKQAEAERLRDEGMDRAAAAEPDRVTLGRVAFLNALLRLPDHIGTIDDATDATLIASAFEDGGKWRGTVPRSLASDGFIESVDAVKSRRTSRHCGYVTRWRLVDPIAAKTYVGRLLAALDVSLGQQKTGSMAATTEPANSQTQTTKG